MYNAEGILCFNVLGTYSRMILFTAFFQREGISMTKKARKRFFLHRSVIIILLLTLTIMGVITKPGAGANKAQQSANIIFILMHPGA